MKNKKLILILISLALLYIITGSFVVYKYQHTPDENLFDVSFCFGPLVRNIVINHTYSYASFTAFRMPFIPFFLSAIAISYNNLLFAYLVKNLIFYSLIFACMYIVRKDSRGVNKYILVLIAAYGLSFPQLALHGFAIDYGEGYLIAFISLLFVGILRAREIRSSKAFLALAFMNSLMFLTKSNTILLSVAVCFFYYWVTENRMVFFTFLFVLCVAFAAWGLFNLHNSGRFTILCSSNGFSFYKGNNELALSVYPERSLDLLSGRLAPRSMGTSGWGEWEIDKGYTRKALEFIKEHPLDAARLFLAKAYVMFFRIRNVADENEGRYPLLKYLGMAYMFIFRIVFLGCFLSAAKSVFFGKDKIATVYIGFILAYSIPCLAGFTYERHVMPLVYVTLFYLAWLLNKRHNSDIIL